MFRFASRIAAFVAVVVCLCGSPIQAAAQRFEQVTGGGTAIGGEIVIPVPGFWDNIDVILEYETGQPVAYTHTTNMRFNFVVSQPGSYFVLIDLPGFEKVRERVDLIPGMNGIPVRIFMVPEGAKEMVNELKRKYPKKAVDEFEKGQGELKKGDMEKAVQRLAAALKEDPKFYDAQLLLATVYYKMGRMPDAELAFRKANELDPKAPLPLVNLGQLYIETADASAAKDAAAAAKVYQAAFDALSKAVNLDPASASATFLFGVSAYKLNRNDEAESSLKTALGLNKKMHQAHVMLANLFIRKQEWQKALDSLDNYLKDNATAPDAKTIQETRAKVAELVKAGVK